MPEIVLVHAPEPSHPGGGVDIRARALRRELERHFSVRLLTLGSGGDVPTAPHAMSRLGAVAHGVPPRFTQRFDPGALKRVLAEIANARVVIAETLFALPYVVDAAAAVVLDAHNIESEVVGRLARRHSSVARRTAYRLSWQWSVSWERRMASRVAQVWAVSTPEAQWFARTAADVVVVPNGVDVPASPLPEAPDAALLFVGSLRAQFNRDGVGWFLAECWPTIRAEVPGVVLHLVGEGSTDFTGPGVVPHGFVQDLESVYQRAQLAIVPLLDGAGTRLKVLEAMAVGRPVVSTAIGAEGIDLVDGRDAVIADAPVDFASACMRLLRSADERERVAAAGRALVLSRYDWSAVGESAARAIERLL